MTAIIDADQKALLWISSLVGKSPLLDSLMRLFATDYFIPVILSIILVGLWFWGGDPAQREFYQRTAIIAAIAFGITNGLIQACNHFYFRPRPFEEFPQLLAYLEGEGRIFYPPHDSSFPSNAAGVTFAIATGIWLKNHRFGYFVYFLALLMPLARVYAGVHYPLDVVGGAAIGILVAYLVARFLMPLMEPFFKLFFRFVRKLCIA
jgi:undecaprenyl-diphosphatase